MGFLTAPKPRDKPILLFLFFILLSLSVKAAYIPFLSNIESSPLFIIGVVFGLIILLATIAPAFGGGPSIIGSLLGLGGQAAVGVGKAGWGAAKWAGSKSWEGIKGMGESIKNGIGQIGGFISEEGRLDNLAKGLERNEIQRENSALGLGEQVIRYLRRSVEMIQSDVDWLEEPNPEPARTFAELKRRINQTINQLQQTFRYSRNLRDLLNQVKTQLQKELDAEGTEENTGVKVEKSEEVINTEIASQPDVDDTAKELKDGTAKEGKEVEGDQENAKLLIEKEENIDIKEIETLKNLITDLEGHVINNIDRDDGFLTNTILKGAFDNNIDAANKIRDNALVGMENALKSLEREEEFLQQIERVAEKKFQIQTQISESISSSSNALRKMRDYADKLASYLSSKQRNLDYKVI